MIRRSTLFAFFSTAAFAADPVTMDSLKWFTQDRDFQPIEPAAWVYEGVQKAFVGDFANPKTFPYIDDLAAVGVTVIHTGGPEPYSPLKREGGAGIAAKESALMQAAFARMRSHGMRVVIGVSPYAPVDIVKQHPEWRNKATPDEKPIDPALDLTKPETVAFRSMSLNTPYGDYLNTPDHSAGLAVRCRKRGGRLHAARNRAAQKLVFRRASHAALVLADIPFALVGGVLAVFASGGSTSIGSWVGFVTLFGISTRYSIMLISHYEHLVEKRARHGPSKPSRAAQASASSRSS